MDVNKPCTVDDCGRRANHKGGAQGMCGMHYLRWRRTGDPNVVRPPGRGPSAERLEDLQWMAETGEIPERAAARLGISLTALEQWAGRHAPEEWRRLRNNLPPVSRMSVKEFS